ncbi:hypothetical protein GOV12_03275 [Candidatus Pacearchaeota archaeon]|nr:hypothetical protein [Candidatus Pacearchaeota archaeon]
MMFEMIDDKNSVNLYEELEELDELNETISDQFEFDNEGFDKFNAKLEKYEPSYGFSFPKFTSVMIPEVDFGMLEVEMFKKYSRNNVLRRAINGTQTIEERLDELESDWDGICRYFPCPEDSFYEGNRLELGELIPVQHLEKRGVDKIDNYVSGISIALPPLGVVYYGVCNVLNNIAQNDPDFIRFAVGGALVLFSVFGLVAHGFGHYKQGQFRGDHLYDESRWAAQFLDEKIKEVFR